MTRTFPENYLLANPEETQIRLRVLNQRMGMEALDIKGRNGGISDDELPEDERHALDAIAHIMGSLVGSAALADKTESLTMLITGVSALFRLCDDMESHPNLPKQVTDMYTITADILEGKN